MSQENVDTTRRFVEALVGGDYEVAAAEVHPDHNAEHGIYAVPGTIDGGGNRAKHNGNPAQCVGVRCK